LHNLAGPLTGDLLLVSNYADGYYFAQPLLGMHGGLHPQDSWASLALGWPESPQAKWNAARAAFSKAIQARCQAEDGRQPSTADMLAGLSALLLAVP